MAHRARWMLLALGLALAVAAVAEEGTTPLDSVPTAETESLDSVDEGTSRALDQVDLGDTEPLDSVEVGQPQALDGVRSGATHSLDAAERDHGWEPPACGAVAVNLGPMPPGTDRMAWSDKLQAAQQRIGESQQRLALANAAYARSLHFEHTLGQERAAVIQTRDLARADYGRARCALPQLIDHAGRAGVAADVLRPYL